MDMNFSAMFGSLTSCREWEKIRDFPSQIMSFFSLTHLLFFHNKIQGSKHSLNLQILLYGSSECGLGHGTDNALFSLPVLEEQHGRDAPDPVLCRYARAVIGVELEAGDLPGVLLGQFVHHRCYHPAWPAPGRPKLHQHRVFACNH